MDRACLVFVHKQYADLEELADAEFLMDYGRMVLLRLPPGRQ